MSEASCSSTPPGPPLGAPSLLWATEAARRRFFAHAWETAPAHVHGVDRMLAGAQLHTELLGLDELSVLKLARQLDRDALGGKGHATIGVPSHLEAASNDAMNCGRGLTHCKVRCVEWGAGCADHHLARGWSLVINSAHTLHGGLHQLVSEWWSTFGVYVGVNLYLSPAAREHSAFGHHADEADIFVLQLQGSKLWSVCERVLPAANAPPVRWEEQPAGAARNCTEIELRRGDTLYLPVGVGVDPAREHSATERRVDTLPQVGTVHRATPRGVASLHASVSVDRVYDADHAALRGFDWAGLLLALFDQARRADGAVGAGGGGGPGPELGPMSAEDAEDVTLWVNEAAAMASGEALRRIPRAFTSADVSDAAGGDSGAASYSPNALLLPCQSGGGDGVGDCAAQFRTALRDEFDRRIEPVLVGPLLGGASPLGAGGPEAAAWLRALCRRAMGDDGLLGRAVASLRSAMQDTMPALSPRSGFGDEARAARSDAAARAAERASHVGLHTRVQRSSGARPLLADADADGLLRANTAHAAGWPQRVPPGTRRAVRWALGAYSGAAGRPFTAVELAAQRGAWAPDRRGTDRDDAESWRNGSAREVVRWLVARQLLDAAPAAADDGT